MTDSWTANSTTSTSIRLVGSPHGTDSAFHPTFTYPIFGEAETIYGYQSLSINLNVASGSLIPLLDIKYRAKNEATTAQLDDVDGKLKEFLPSDYISSSTCADASAKFGKVLKENEPDFRPFGDKVHNYTRRKVNKGKGKSIPTLASCSSLSESDADARVFEIYRSTWDTPGFREYHRRMQLFVLLFIEGASYIHEDEGNWEFFTLYEKAAGRWHFVGYTSLYKFWCWPDSSRIRLSQFVILPPYQKQGHGGMLYNCVYDQIRDRSNVSELTVEDPSEDFDRLRDGNDLRRLLCADGLVECAKSLGKLDAPVDAKWMEQKRLEHKLAQRQWARVLEMVQLMNLDVSDQAKVKAYRLQVKARIWRQNKDILVQLDKNQVREKLQETFEGVIEEYGDMVGVDVEGILEQSPTSGHFGGGNDEEEDEDGEEQDERDHYQNGNGPARKMARFA
ncbi:related to histone acetyltransferase subunit HAT1 [Melanopsichium pennsylvanicum]|uniref:Histone acetyltransferase type B catalytic subunit n=2 Tax=Melanopsichium pennsylvanicum TaxID=63383 RepID=A0AAJ4XL31_9BASI|nr:related to histone acetyltransferase subunit HAT1 [Melanopsichium pennsylvanicum 4]SNX84277.1 related to histone acetyltransferase subunit HAT1 [Melanopsichium pennsylvanicum]